MHCPTFLANIGKLGLKFFALRGILLGSVHQANLQFAEVKVQFLARFGIRNELAKFFLYLEHLRPYILPFD
jgi:hypothetical protein